MIRNQSYEIQNPAQKILRESYCPLEESYDP